jgi:hypothetical protein
LRIRKNAAGAIIAAAALPIQLPIRSSRPASLTRGVFAMPVTITLLDQLHLDKKVLLV